MYMQGQWRAAHVCGGGGGGRWEVDVVLFTSCK